MLYKAQTTVVLGLISLVFCGIGLGAAWVQFCSKGFNGAIVLAAIALISFISLLGVQILLTRIKIDTSEREVRSILEDACYPPILLTGIFFVLSLLVK